jgi:hypothetical protein
MQWHREKSLLLPETEHWWEVNIKIEHRETGYEEIKWPQSDQGRSNADVPSSSTTWHFKEDSVH